MFDIGEKIIFNLFDGQICGKGIIRDYDGVKQYDVEVIKSDDLDENEKMVSCTEEEMQLADFNIPMTEEKIEDILTNIIFDNAEETEFEDCEICTFKDKGLLSMDKGIVITLADGSEIHLTIQGYNADGRRIG